MSAKHVWRRGALLIALPLALQLAAAAPAPAAGPQPFLAGLTSQTQPMLVRMSPDGASLAHVYSTLQLKCTSGGIIFLPDTFADVDVSTLRHFSQTVSVPPVTSGGISIALSGSFKGQVDRTRTRVSGTAQMTVVQRDTTTNAITDTCASGLVTFSVHR